MPANFDSPAVFDVPSRQVLEAVPSPAMQEAEPGSATWCSNVGMNDWQTDPPEASKQSVQLPDGEWVQHEGSQVLLCWSRCCFSLRCTPSQDLTGFSEEIVGAVTGKPTVVEHGSFSDVGDRLLNQVLCFTISCL